MTQTLTHFINGEKVAADTPHQSLNPSNTDEVVARVPLGGATQTIGAAVASPTEAELLQVKVGSPLLRCERVTRSLDGDPVLLSEHLFPAHLTVFEVDLPHVEASIAPTGLRLVE